MPCCCCCASILVYCSVRDWTRTRYVTRFENIRIHPSTRYRIRCGFIFFHFKNTRIRCRIRRMRVDGSRIREEKVADSKIFGYVWMEPKRNLNSGISSQTYILIPLLNTNSSRSKATQSYALLPAYKE